MMKIREILEIEHKISNRKLHYDIDVILDTEYYSESRGELVKVGDLELTHLLRIYKHSCIDHKEENETVRRIRELLDNERTI